MSCGRTASHTEAVLGLTDVPTLDEVAVKLLAKEQVREPYYSQLDIAEYKCTVLRSHVFVS